MKIEKINDNKIRIILTSIDLKEKNIDIQSFVSNSIESQELFWDILDEAEKECGFKANDCQLIIEALAVNGGNFILTVTKLEDTKSNSPKIKYRKPRITAKIKNSNLTHEDTNIYKFSSFDNFLGLVDSVNIKDAQSLLKDVILYEYNNTYYLLFKISSVDIKRIKKISSIFSEFGSFVKDSYLFERKLSEYGTLICEDNAISTIKKSFKTKKTKAKVTN